MISVVKIINMVLCCVVLYCIVGRVKNPDFVKEVRSLCKEDHHLIVVIIIH